MRACSFFCTGDFSSQVIEDEIKYWTVQVFSILSFQLASPKIQAFSGVCLHTYVFGDSVTVSDLRVQSKAQTEMICGSKWNDNVKCLWHGLSRPYPFIIESMFCPDKEKWKWQNVGAQGKVRHPAAAGAVAQLTLHACTLPSWVLLLQAPPARQVLPELRTGSQRHAKHSDGLLVTSKCHCCYVKEFGLVC